ncbi:MAG TPA: superinfection immunity protein [Granulicella sp.]
MIHLAIVTLLYFLPTILAAHRGHRVTGILVLNVLVGWTCIGWIALLLWAVLSTPRYVVVPPPYAAYPGWRR